MRRQARLGTRPAGDLAVRPSSFRDLSPGTRARILAALPPDYQARLRSRIEDGSSPPAAPSPSLVGVLDALGRSRRWVAIAAVAVAAGGYVVGSLLPERFEATTVLEVAGGRARTSVLGGAPALPDPSVARVAALATGDEVADRALSEADHAGAEDLSISASIVEGSDAVEVRATAGDPDVAEAGARAATAAVVSVLRDERTAAIDAARVQLDAQAGAIAGEIDEITAELALTSVALAAAEEDAELLRERVATLERRRDGMLGTRQQIELRSAELAVEAEVGPVGVDVVSDPVARRQTRPEPWHLALLGGLLALLGATAVVYARLALAGARHGYG